MNYYVDIQVNPDAEMRENVLLNKVYMKFHKVLFDLDAIDLGVSFPQWKVTLGRTLRLHSSKERLTALQQTNWLGGLVGYCDAGEVLLVPNECQYRTVSRVQPTMTGSKLRRLIKRGSISEGEVKAYRVKMFANGLNEPYLELESSSNGNKHRRYLVFGELLESEIKGKFDSFGLSSTSTEKYATVPWF